MRARYETEPITPQALAIRFRKERMVKAERLPVQRPRSVRVAAVAGDEAAQRDRLNAVPVTPRNHFVCSVCGRTLMTGESAQMDTLHGHEAEVVCELCQRKRPARPARAARGKPIEARKRAD